MGRPVYSVPCVCWERRENHLSRRNPLKIAEPTKVSRKIEGVSSNIEKFAMDWSRVQQQMKWSASYDLKSTGAVCLSIERPGSGYTEISGRNRDSRKKVNSRRKEIRKQVTGHQVKEESERVIKWEADGDNYLYGYQMIISYVFPEINPHR